MPSPVERVLKAAAKERTREAEALDNLIPGVVDAWPQGGSEGEGESRISIHQGRAQIEGVLRRIIESAAQELQLILSGRGMARLFDAPDLLRLLVKRGESGVAVQLVTEIADEDRARLSPLAKAVEIRHLELPTLTWMLLADAREVAFLVSAGSRGARRGSEETMLWADAPDLVLAQRGLFDLYWNLGTSIAARDRELDTGRPAPRVQALRGRRVRLDKMRRMVMAATRSVRLLAPSLEWGRWDEMGLLKLLRRRQGDGVLVEVRLGGGDVRAPAGLEVETVPDAPPIAFLLVDDAEVLVAFGVAEEPQALSNPDEHAILSSHPDALEFFGYAWKNFPAETRPRPRVGI